MLAETALRTTSTEESAPAQRGRDAELFAFLAAARREGIHDALVTIVGVDGGSPQGPGAHMAVLADGRHVGHISGGCVEPAVASEIVPVIAGGKDQVVRFGKDSCFIDIRFPCGGGVDLLVHVDPDPALLETALDHLARRQPFGIAFEPARSIARLTDAPSATGWQDGAFVRRYLPRTRLVLAGRGPDFEVLARVAAASELELVLLTPDAASAPALAGLGARVDLLTSPRERPAALGIDRWTAMVLLFHEHEWEDLLLAEAATADGFYVGALGSVRTQRLRRERLLAAGLPAATVDRIRGPIGLIDRAREPGPLALSILAEIVAARAELDRN